MNTKKIPMLLMLLVLTAFMTNSCTGGKSPSAEEEAETDSLAADSLAQDTVVDLVAEVPQSKAVDELFDDFFFNFAGNKRMQMSRIQFPLPVHANGHTTMLERRQWKRSYFFMSDGYYVVLLDDIDDDALSKDTTVNKAYVERLDFDSGKVKRYDFQRLRGEWRLTAITHNTLENHDNASFFKFYKHFATDEDFQVESLGSFVLMTAPDSDEEFTEVTGSISPEQWPAFKPDLIPSGVVYFVNYGQHDTSEKQKGAITAISRQTMDAVIAQTQSSRAQM
jgi:hypothetical protein